MYRWILSLVLASHACFCCKGQVKFEKVLSWHEVKEKARQESKYIFVDCYATWCVPCKMMDEKVYNSRAVGDFMDGKFVSMKLQIDTSAYDTDHIKKRYSDAKAFREQYKIESLPAYFFFSPSGELVYKASGYKESSDFLTLCSAALDSSKQYYTLLKRYQNGSREQFVLRDLALAAVMIGEKDLGRQVAKTYKEVYLDRLSQAQICTKENLEFISQFPELVQSSDPIFDLFVHHKEEVDKTTAPGFSDSWVNYMIQREEILDKLWRDGQPISLHPDWSSISTNIQSKYLPYFSDRLIINAQRTFYTSINSCSDLANVREEQIRRFPPTRGEGTSSDQWTINEDAWYIFQHCDDKVILNKALKWIEIALAIDQPDPNVQIIDTKANLLYKLGRVSEAIECERKAIATGIAYAKRRGVKKGDFFDDLNEMLEKMLAGKPTWVIQSLK